MSNSPSFDKTPKGKIFLKCLKNNQMGKIKLRIKRKGIC